MINVFTGRKNNLQEVKQKLPPKQKQISSILRWGIDHPGITTNLPNMLLDSWMLMVDGLVHNPRNFNWTDFMELPQSNSTSDFHCVETWSVLNQNWQGVLFKDLASIVKPKKNAKIAWFESADGYTTSLPIEELIGDEILLAHTLNEEPLPQPLGGPMRIVIPHKYAYKSAMWIKHIEFVEDERLGFWEKGIYSNTADVWKDDRYK